MARTRAPSHLLSLVESDSEDDLGASYRQTTTAATRDMPPAKRGRPAAASKPAVGKVAKPASKAAASAETRRANERRGAAAAAALDADADADTTMTTTTATTTSRGRRALSDRTNELTAAESEPPVAKPRGRPAGRKAAAAAAAAAATEAEAEAEAEDDAATREPEPVAAAPVVPKKRGRGRPRATAEHEETDTSQHAPGPEIPETQPVDSMQVDVAEPTSGDTTAQSVQPGGLSSSPLRRHRPSLPAPSPTRARGISPSASDDVSLRRRLGELTKKYETLESRYRDLREIGVKEAERNFDRLKKQGEDRAKASNDLIASLKAELNSFRELAKEGTKAKREWDASEVRAAELAAQIDELKVALGNAKAESKTLATKLAAARTAAEVPSLPASLVMPGSAIKTSVPTAASARAAVEAMQASTQTAQLKEDLYGDLTGLLVRSAKRDASREMYDCIQTGRNGSLHFKLCIDDDTNDDAQFVYTPQLDPSRDAALIELLPDYLVEEISFPRVQAAKFYKRVMQSLTEEL